MKSNKRLSKNIFSRVILTTFLSSVLILSLVSCSQDSGKAPSLPDDQTITETVTTQLAQATEVPADSIRISTNEGIVRLKGSTSNLLAKKQAGEVGESVSGVLSVINNLKVTVDRPDKAVQQDVQRMLATDPATENWDLAAMVHNGMVTLTGTVDSWQEKQLASKIASGVKGVSGIKNNLLISYTRNPDDSEIKSEIKTALMYDSRIRDNLIKVSVEDAEVTLSGSVGSINEKQLAINKAHVRGVVDVTAENLEVHPEYNNSRLVNNKIADLKPDQIKEAVQRAFEYDPRVPADSIEVQIENDLAILSGSVLNLNSKLAAGSDAQNTSGINTIENNITVKHNIVVKPKIPTTDKAIKERIKESIIRDPYVESIDVSVNVEKGIVTLSGEVRSPFEKEQIEEITQDVKGVIKINNNLTVASQKTASH